MSKFIYFLHGNNELLDEYYSDKTYRDDIIVELNGIFYELYFHTNDSLKYEMTKDGYFSMPGLIILDDISTEKIIIAVKELEKIGYFQRLKGVEKLSQESRFIHDWYINKLSLYDEKKIVKIEIA